MDDFELELKSGFLEEAAQLLSDTEQCFLALETTPGDSQILDKIFRLAHNLKGSSKAVGFDSIGEFAHLFESFLLKVKNGEIATNQQVVTILLKCNDHLQMMVETLKGDFSATIDSADLSQRITDIMNGVFADSSSQQPEQEEPPQVTAPEVASEVTSEAVSEPGSDVAVAQEEIADFKLAVVEDSSQPESEHQKPDGGKKASSSGAAQTDESIRVSLGRLESLLNFVGELVILETVLKEQVYSDNPNLMRKTVNQLGKVTKEIQDISMSLRMVPLKQTFNKLQRIVRDTSNALEKKVIYETLGDSTEVDKTVLESLSDPLVHIIRNSVDHGIESAEARLKAGKPEAGRVQIKAFHQSGKLVIEVSDDGGGINPEVIRKKALEKKIISENQNLTERELLYLIFHPGFSTKAVATDVSGRGVGMDVVKTNIENLQGEVEVESVVGKGSVFRILLPLTLAIIDGLIIRSSGERYVVPLNHVKESFRPKGGDVQQMTGLDEVLKLREENLPTYRLNNLLGKKRASPQAPEDLIALIIKNQNAPYAVLVDEIVGQHQVVIKKLGAEIRSIKGISGSAILGDGKPSLILEMQDLVIRKSNHGQNGQMGRVA